MDWIKKHVDTVIILTAFASSILWLNGKFNDIDRNFYKVDAEIMVVKNTMDQRFAEVEKEIAIVKTIMIVKNIMPVELANVKEEK